MKIILLYEPNTEIEIKDFKYSDYAYEKPPIMIEYAKTKDILLDKRYSKTTNSSYITHICPNCNSIQGDYYIVEDNHQKTKLIERLQVAYCPTCKEWHECSI